MENDPIISKHLEESEGYSDKLIPSLLTSGEFLAPYYVNTEKLCRDKNISQFLEEHGDDSAVIINHAINLQYQHKSFHEDINRLAEKVDELLPRGNDVTVSGGQRRDWIFSGPIARVLGIPHISIYKHEPGEAAKIEIIGRDGVIDYTSKPKLPFNTTVHVPDLLTTGSSCYSKDKDTGKEYGWIPALRAKGVKVRDLVVVVTRLQGGEEMLAGLEDPVYVHSFVAIDKNFLQKHSKQPHVAIGYVKNERLWTESYILDNGVDVLVPYFDPEGNKLVSAKKFLRFYNDFLVQFEKIDELKNAVKDKYGKSLKEIIGGV